MNEEFDNAKNPNVKSQSRKASDWFWMLVSCAATIDTDEVCFDVKLQLWRKTRSNFD